MVHALHEAHRVLKPDGILIDLRPAARHRRVGLGEGEHWQAVVVMREPLGAERAANRAVREVVSDGLFLPQRRVEFKLDRVMDTMDDFRKWLDDFNQTGECPPYDRLVKRLERARGMQPGNPRIIVRGPLVLRAMSKKRFNDQH